MEEDERGLSRLTKALCFLPLTFSCGTNTITPILRDSSHSRSISLQISSSRVRLLLHVERSPSAFSTKRPGSEFAL